MHRVGIGSDTHKLEPGDSLKIGGVDIPSDVTSVGHSDGDALLHAVTDAILGALAKGDIGSHFSDLDDRWKDADSALFLKQAVGIVGDEGYVVANVDSVVHLEKPKIRPYVDQIRQRISGLLGIDLGCVSIKGKTGEGLDAIGERRAIKAEACVLLRKRE